MSVAEASSASRVWSVRVCPAVKSSRSRMVSRKRLVLAQTLAHTRQTSPSLGFDFADIYRFVLEVRRSIANLVYHGHILEQILRPTVWFPEQHAPHEAVHRPATSRFC